MADEDDRENKRPRSRPDGRKTFAERRGERPDFSGKPRASSGKKPFAKRRDEGGHGSPKRDFGASGDGRKPGGSKRGGSKPFVKREREDGERPARSFEKREHHGGAGRPFQKRDPSGAGPRPGRHERAAGAGHGQATSRRDAGPSRRSSSPRPEETDQSERIAKRLARAGIASRRDAEALVVDGRVKVNGAVISSPALNVLPSDRIELDGVEIPAAERTRLFLFHKPAGVVTTNRDPEGRRTVFDVLPADLPRLMTVGRLDINTEGLLLLTNDGGLARVLELPATGWLRRYRVRVHGKVEESALAGLRDGIAVDGVFYGGIEAALDREQGSNAWLTIGLREGKNREVKNVLGALGLDVTRLIRISYGPFQLGELPEGAVQELKGRMLRDQLGERLIEEAGANFEAPVANAFPNRPVRKDERREERPRIARDDVGEGGLIKRRSRGRPDDRASALSRLTTKPDARRPFKGGKGKPMARDGKEQDGRAEPTRARTANVWMAPGARPQGKKAQTPAPPAPRSRGEGKGEGRRFESKGEGKRFGKPGERRFEKTGEGRRFEGKGEGKRFGPPKGSGPRGPRRDSAPSGQRPSSPSGRGGGKKGGPGADRRR